MPQYGINQLGKNIQIFEPVFLGFPARYNLGKEKFQGCIIGDDATLRPGTTIYCDVVIGSHFSTGHNVMVREKMTIGDNVSLGTNVIIEGNCQIGDHVNLQSLVYVPTNTIIGSHVFIGPNTVLTNDKYPPHGGMNLHGPVIEDHASIGANATILPGVTIGSGSLVAAGAVVTKDVPAYSLAIGALHESKNCHLELKDHDTCCKAGFW
jgi:acetyltransferase-like isoleucine patch superfamily enzyme